MASTIAAAAFLKHITNHESEEGRPNVFDTTSLKGIYDIRAEDGRLTCLFPVLPHVENRVGTLHGGCIATLIDVVGTAALLTQTKRAGVSLSINTNYLRPLPSGTIALIDATVVRIGKSIATISVDILDANTHKLIAQGTHVKFISENEPDMSLLAKGLIDVPPLPLRKTRIEARSKL